MRPLRLPLLILLVVALVAMVGPAAAAPGAAATRCEGPLHPKSAAGLMPPACGLDPDMPAPATIASDVDFLAAPINTTVGSWAQLVAAADLNHDGVAEAAVSTAAYFDKANDWQVHLLRQAGAVFERVQRRPAQKYAEATVALDANHDGLMDLAVSGETGIALIPQLSAAAEPLGETVSVLSGQVVDALAVGDVTGDLRPDLLAVVPEADTILAWASTPEGLRPYELGLAYPTDGYSALAVGDLNNDGLDDLAALRGSGYASESVVVFLQRAGGFADSLTLTPETGSYLPHSLAIGDVTGDGLDDLVVTAGGNAPSAYLNAFVQQVTDATTTPPASGLAPSPIVYEAHHLPGAVQIGDLNHDGREDVVLANDAWRTISVYTQSATATLDAYATAQIPYSSRYRPNALALADFDGDGGMDVAAVGRDPGLTVRPNAVGAPVATIVTPAPYAKVSSTPTISGTTTPGTDAVEVRVRGLSAWAPATLDGTSWSAAVELPGSGRPWVIEARAIRGERYQAPPAAIRVRALGRARDGLLVEYHFDEAEGATVHDTAGAGEPLDLTLADEQAVSRVPEGLFVHTPTRIASPEAATRVTGAITRSNEFTLEAWIRTANLTQDGPARIMTLSEESPHLNVSLIQSRFSGGMARVGLRLSTSQPPAGKGWHEVAADLPLTADLTHVLVTRAADGTLILYLNGVEQGRQVIPGDLSAWSDSYRLLFANDDRAERPWLGEYHLAAIYQRALTPDEVAQNYGAGPDGDGSPAQITDAQVVYRFDEGGGTTVGDSSLVRPALPAQIADPTAVNWSSGRLTVSAPTIIASGGPAAKVSRASMATGEISIEAWVTPANTTQRGPARIVTISQDTLLRNVTLGQGLWGNQPADLYLARLRSTTTSSNGEPHLITPPGSLTPALTHVVYTRDVAGTARLFIDGEERISGKVDGDLGTWDAGYRLALANEFTLNRVWLGDYHFLAIYSRALSPVQVGARFHAGPEGDGARPLATAVGPYVQRVEVDGGADTTADRAVRLDITAQMPAGVTLAQVTVAEYGFDAGHGQWALLQRGALAPATQGGYHWELAAGAGVRYLQIWIADSAGTHASYPYQTFINRTPAQASLAQRKTDVYRFALSAGEQLSVRLAMTRGDADLYVWGPAGDTSMRWVGNSRGRSDQVSLTAPVDGLYQVEVYGFSQAVYELTTTRGAAVAGEREGPAAAGLSAADTEAKPLPEAPSISLDSAPEDRAASRATVYLPLIVR